MEPFRVSSHSNPNATAGAIANAVRERGATHLQVIGAGALNQAVKAIAIARSFLGPEGVDLVCAPSFADVRVDGQLRTAIRLAVHERGAEVDFAEASIEQVDTRPSSTIESD